MPKPTFFGKATIFAISCINFTSKVAFCFSETNFLSLREISIPQRSKYSNTISRNNNKGLIHSRYLCEMENYGNISAHYIFLVHGWLGNSKEMEYLRSSIDQEASLQKHDRSEIITYSPTSNDRQTTDGIANGGKRLKEEILEFIRSKEYLRSDSNSGEDSIRHVSISFVGNSLGGLYSRYCLSLLPQDLIVHKTCDREGGDLKVLLHRRIFATTGQSLILFVYMLTNELLGVGFYLIF